MNITADAATAPAATSHSTDELAHATGTSTVSMPCYDEVLDDLDAVTAHQRECDVCGRELALAGEVA